MSASALVALAFLGAAACGDAKQGPFGWLHARSAPASWTAVRIPTGSVLSYPPGWQTVHGDRGTATVTLLGSGGQLAGYLNVTPRQGDEKLAGWASFRVSHNADEGDRGVKLLGSASGLKFLDGRGSCVKDSYLTSIGARYIEIACIVQGSTSASVIVAAVPPSAWARVSPQLERAIEGFRA